MTTIQTRLDNVRLRIQSACQATGRSIDSITLLAVSKTFDADSVAAAFAAGQVAFGENYIQEAEQKITLLRHLPLQWHCIGPIQSNKTRLVAENFDWVHSIDRLKIAERLNAQRPANLAPLQVCIQINVDCGPSKSGVAPHEALALAKEIIKLPRLQLRGLMCIPEPTTDFSAACALFNRAKDLFGVLNTKGLGLDTLSMGMSADLEAAIASGSTMVRVGSAIFGARQYPAQ